MGMRPGIAIVTRPTRMEGLLQRWATRGQAHYMFRQRKAQAFAAAGDMEMAAVAMREEENTDFSALEDEDESYRAGVRILRQELDLGLPVWVVEREQLPNVRFDLFEVVVVVGQDGLVANTAKYVGALPIVGVNPDPQRIDGVLLPYGLDQARSAVRRVLDGRATVTDITLAEARLDDGQSLLAFNDLFIGAASHVSARYELQVDGRAEEQSSSGVLVATGAGSTGWMSSVFNMARGVTAAFGQGLHQGFTSEAVQPPLGWDDRSLLWAVREPFRSNTTGVQLVAGQIHGESPMVIESRMASDGVIFSDGVQSDFLEFNGGAIATIGVASQRARLVVPPRFFAGRNQP